MQRLGTRVVSVMLASVSLVALSVAQSAQKPNLEKDPTLYVVGYAHLDTEWRWEYPQVIDEYLRKTMEDNFKLFDKYPHYIFNFSGANRYRLMKEYYPSDFAEVQRDVAAGRWFPAGSSMEEGDVNAPSAEGILRQILYGNEWFHREFGKTSKEFMLPDCFGFPASLPTILAHAGVRGFSTQKLTWGSSANAGGPDSLERTPEGTPFNVGVWVGPDGESVLAALNPGAYSGGITTDLSSPLPPLPPNPALTDVEKKLAEVQQRLQGAKEGSPDREKNLQEFFALRTEQEGIELGERESATQRYQGDWAARVLNNGKVTGLFTDYHYYGTGDIGGAPDEESVKRLEAIVTKGTVSLPPQNGGYWGQNHPEGPAVRVGEGPVHVISATADQMFRDINSSEAANLPRYTGELELTNHSAGSLTSQAYQKRWIRKEELLADAAEKSSVAAAWLGGRTYPMARLNGAWTLAMGAHFHDLAAGTATPKAYEFAWNDDVIALNQFADVLKSGAEAVSAAMDTAGAGVPVIVFNPLSIEREDVVEASLKFPGGLPAAVHVVAPDGGVLPAQISDGKVLFEANVPSVGYAVFHVVRGGVAGGHTSPLRVTQDEMENAYYRVKLNSDGDVASIFDKQVNRELLAAPARLALSYDNPSQWPAWNMDWDQEQAAPRAYVSGPAKIRIVEKGPVRVAIEVSRETDGSRFVQTISLAAGDAGKRVEFGNVIDWNTRETNLKATFPLTASNQMATYNWDIGTIERPTAQPKKFEVPSHQWIDLTDMSGKFGATILTDCKNGSDKPNDHTIRLTLIRTPGTAGGYADQGTQDIGHHEFTYGIAGHVDGWRKAQTDWQAERLNNPLIAFESTEHRGELGKIFSLVKVSNPRIRMMALKKAEQSDEYIVRLVELDGKPEPDVRISFATPITSAREVNGQEQPVGAANIVDGGLVTSFGAYQPRTFAIRLGSPHATVADVHSAPVALDYDLATASNTGDADKVGFDGKGDALPAEMLPGQIAFNGMIFHLAPAKTGTPNAVIASGQKIKLPEGPYNRVYILAASANGDQNAEFEVGNDKKELDVEDWGGFIGQWDDRQWSSAGGGDNYGEMIGLKPGFIKRADLAWYCTHHHDAAGKNVAYSYSYLFGYGMDLPAGARTLTLPNDQNIRILAISVAQENPRVQPAQPLYDVLPSPHAGPPDFSMSTSSGISVAQGMTTESNILMMPMGGFHGDVQLRVSGLPDDVRGTFHPAIATGRSVLTLTATKSAASSAIPITITGTSGKLSHSITVKMMVTPVLKDAVPVDLSADYNVRGIYKKGSRFDSAASLDDGGFSLSEETLGAEQVGDEVTFNIGPADAEDAVTSKTVALPKGSYSSLRILATAVEGNQRRQVFTVSYTDGTSSSFTQSLSDWSGSVDIHGESEAVHVPYRLAGDGSTDANPFYLYAYSLPLDPTKQVRSVTLPQNRNVVVFALTLVPQGE
ncbi:MAG: glycoside hydrolase family 38 C-terminal domain-containing protein [Acidobacteriaceae bacterium]